MSYNLALDLIEVSKCYQIYEKPHHRLLQALLRNKKKFYREFWALRSINLQVMKGEVIGIVGKNGSGKSTLLQIISGVLNPTHGRVSVSGRMASLLELGAGFNYEFSGRENIYLNGAIIGLDRALINERIQAILNFAEIGDFIDQPVKTYSSGMFVRLAFAIQVNLDPEILIIDEALAVGDAYFVHKCMDHLSQLRKKGTTILLVSHDGFFIKRFCDRVMWIEDGRAVRLGNAEEVVDAYLNKLFNIPESSVKSVESVDVEVKDILKPHRRVGDGRYIVTHASLKNNLGEDVNEVEVNNEVTLCFTVLNKGVTSKDAIFFGYILKNPRGEELAASNTVGENVNYSVFEEGETKNIEVRIQIPSLNSGSYAFTLSIAYKSQDEEKIIVADRLFNVLILRINNPKNITTLIELDSKFRVY